MRRCLILGVLTLASAAHADEPAAVLEFGGAGEFETRESQWRFGPNLAIEVTPIDNWLELELGVSALRASGSTEWESELLFKKPFELSEKIELMAGLGPTWTHTHAQGERANSAGVELGFDVMFWRTRRWGWYLEPSYSIGFNGDRPRAVGLTAGLLFGLP
jgi:hypothetical protein